MLLSFLKKPKHATLEGKEGSVDTDADTRPNSRAKSPSTLHSLGNTVNPKAQAPGFREDVRATGHSQKPVTEGGLSKEEFHGLLPI